jgi:hypothetical protein
VANKKPYRAKWKGLGVPSNIFEDNIDGASEEMRLGNEAGASSDEPRSTPQAQIFNAVDEKLGEPARDVGEEVGSSVQ